MAPPRGSLRHLIADTDLSRDEMRRILRLALRMKRQEVTIRLEGKVFGMIFFNPSVRTRTSFESILARLGGHAIHLQPGRDTWRFEHRDGVVMDGDTQEHVREAAPVLSRYADAIGIRKSELATASSATAEVTSSWEELRKDAFLSAFARHATVPVVNLESNLYHPCQGLADAMTLLEVLGNPRGRKYVLTWSWHPKSLPMATPHSQLLSAARMGMDVWVLHPEGWDLDPEVMETARREVEGEGGSVRVTHDLEEGYRDAEVVCAKAWGSRHFYGRFDEEKAAKERLRDWIVDERKMGRTRGARFLHCLPVRRNVVVTDEVIESERSLVVEEAENRMWVQGALLGFLMMGAAALEG